MERNQGLGHTFTVWSLSVFVLDKENKRHCDLLLRGEESIKDCKRWPGAPLSQNLKEIWAVRGPLLGLV